MPHRLTERQAGGLGHRSSRGLSLMELMVVMGLAALMAGMAVASFGPVVQQRQLQAAAEALVADLRMARSEAIKRSAVVTVCSSIDGVACTDSANWHQGWIVFLDRDANQQRDASETLIRVQEATAGLASVASTVPRNDKAAFSYQPTGWAKAASQTLLFTHERPQVLSRVVCISSQGRPTLRPAGLSACS